MLQQCLQMDVGCVPYRDDCGDGSPVAKKGKRNEEGDDLQTNAVGKNLLDEVHKRREHWNALIDQTVEFQMIDGMKVMGCLLAIDMDETEILVKDLETPIGRVRFARLRGEDVKRVIAIDANN
eukprot:m.58938 g.58938  ORF g.58938 m.58938 type:complete len:123 (+) comp11291_c1_seq1:196-564(+)